MKKIIYILVCILAFGGGLGATYYGKGELNKQKSLDLVYEKYELKTIDTTKYNETELKEYQTLELKVRQAYVDKKEVLLIQTIDEINILDKKVSERVEKEEQQQRNSLELEFTQLVLPSGATNEETDYYNELHKEITTMFENKVSIDKISPKIKELKSRIAEIQDEIDTRAADAFAAANTESDDENVEDHVETYDDEEVEY